MGRFTLKLTRSEICISQDAFTGRHILEVVSYPAMSNTFIYKTQVNYRVQRRVQMIYLGHNFFCRNSESFAPLTIQAQVHW